MNDTVVISVGHGHRGDDGVGAACLRRLATLGADVARTHARPDAGDLARAMSGRKRAFLIDACRMGAAPGQIRTFDLRDPGLSARLRPRHGMELLEAVALLRALYGLPETCRLIVIEAATLGHGDRLSPPVEAAVRKVADALKRMSHGQSDTLMDEIAMGSSFD
jgi:hydrogenase maturation protease